MEKYIRLCQDYMWCYLRPPEKGWADLYFDEHSYARTSVYKIIHILQQNPTGNPIQIVSDFMGRMETFAKNTTNKKNRFIFATAVDTASDILILFEQNS